MPPPPFSRRGGRRPNAGRPKLPTPVKKAARERRLAHKGVARSYAYSKYCRTEEKLRKMNARKLNGTDQYFALSLQYIKLAKFLNMKKADILLLGILPEIDIYEEPAASALDTIEIDQLCVSSDEDEPPRPSHRPPRRRVTFQATQEATARCESELESQGDEEDDLEIEPRRTGYLNQLLSEESEIEEQPEGSFAPLTPPLTDPVPLDGALSHESSDSPPPLPTSQAVPGQRAEDQQPMDTDALPQQSGAPQALDVLRRPQDSPAAQSAEPPANLVLLSPGTPFHIPIPSHLFSRSAEGQALATTSRNLFGSSDDEDEAPIRSYYRPPLRRVPLGNLIYTAEEFIAIEVFLKIKSNVSDKFFKDQVEAIFNGLDDNASQLPVTRHKAEQQLATMHQRGQRFVIFCEECLEICRQVSKIPKKKQIEKMDLLCYKCGNKNIPEAISDARGYFVIFSIRKQIEGYLRDLKFCKVLNAHKKRTETLMNGRLHKGIVENGHFDLSLGIDAAQLHKTYGKSILPAVLFFNNLPVSWQLRYPILAALWTGASSLKPPRSVFLKFMQDELRDLGSDSPIIWTDEEGVVHTSFVYLTTVIADAPERGELLNQKYNGTYSCPFCKVKGETLTVEKYPNVFRQNPLRRTEGTDKVGGTRFPVFIHHDRTYVWRKSKDRLKVGLEVAQTRRDKGKPNYEKEGLKGLPVLRHLPGPFRETESIVSDFLHMIGEGVFVDIMKAMLKREGRGSHSFLQRGQSWDMFDDMQKNMTRVSECNRNCKLLSNNEEWKAYDRWEFLIHHVAQLCSDENVITNTGVYDCLLHLSNITYLWYLDRITPEVIDQVREEVKLFCYHFKSVFTEEYFTYKAHVLQHIPDMMTLHGSGAYTDAFNSERFISKCKKLCTTTRVHMVQIARNFLLAHQSQILQSMENFSEAAKKTLNVNAFFSEEFFAKYSDVVKSAHADQKIPADVGSVLKEFVEGPMKMNFTTLQVTRVVQMSRKSIILESEHARHRANTSVDDSYIQVEGSVFGRIKDIFHLPQINKFVFILSKYEKTEPQRERCTILYPINQFPYREPEIPDYYPFLLTDNLWVQKAKVCETSYYWMGRLVKLFTVRPHFLFRF